jgi:hypothetical protein
MNIVFTNYLIGHNPQVISQLSRGGLNITTSEEIARRWAQYQRSITQLNHESLLQNDGAIALSFCKIQKYFWHFYYLYCSFVPFLVTIPANKLVGMVILSIQ